MVFSQSLKEVTAVRLDGMPWRLISIAGEFLCLPHQKAQLNHAGFHPIDCNHKVAGVEEVLQRHLVECADCMIE